MKTTEQRCRDTGVKMYYEFLGRVETDPDHLGDKCIWDAALEQCLPIIEQKDAEIDHERDFRKASVKQLQDMNNTQLERMEKKDARLTKAMELLDRVEPALREWHTHFKRVYSRDFPEVLNILKDLQDFKKEGKE